MKFTELYGGAKFVTAGDKSINTQMRGTFNIENENGKTEIIICGLGYFEFKIKFWVWKAAVFRQNVIL